MGIPELTMTCSICGWQGLWDIRRSFHCAPIETATVSVEMYDLVLYSIGIAFSERQGVSIDDLSVLQVCDCATLYARTINHAHILTALTAKESP